MKHWIKRATVMTLMGSALCMTAPVMAQETHVHYQQAISDLQAADALLGMPDEPNIAADQKRVEKAVHNALGDCRHAAWWDGKSSNYTPPPEMNVLAGRLHQINHLLHEALADLQAETDNSKSNGWKVKAINHTTEAMGAMQQVFVDAHIDAGDQVDKPSGN